MLISFYRFYKLPVLLAVLAIVVLPLMGNVSHAQSLVFPKVTETYIGANFMVDIDNQQDSFKNYRGGDSGKIEKRNIGKANTVMIRWGYREERTYAIELGYMSVLNSTTEASSGAMLEHSSSGFFGDLFLFFPLNQQASIYAKIGGARLSTETSSVVGGVSTKSRETDWSQSSGIGLEYLFSPSFAIRGGYENIKISTQYNGKSRHSGFNLGGLIFYE